MKGNLKLLLLGGLAFLFVSCGEQRYEYREWQAPNWTPDGKIVFQEEYCIDIFKNTVVGGISTSEDYTVTLYEMDVDGSNLRPIAILLHYPKGKSPPGPISTSASDTLIVACLRDYSAYRMLLVNRNTGKVIRDLGQGAYADFSPDGKRIVYQKYSGDQPLGIWIMDLESGEERCLVSSEDAGYPAWGTKFIAYVLKIDEYLNHQLWIIDSSGSSKKLIYDDGRGWGTDWGPPDSNAIVCHFWGGWQIFYLEGDSLIKVDTIGVGGGAWSPDGSLFVSAYEGCIHIFNRQGQEVGCYGP